MKLKWLEHTDLQINKKPTVNREDYLDYMTFEKDGMPLFTEIFGPLVGLKEEWEQQGATPEELDLSAFRFRCEKRGYLPVTTGAFGGPVDEKVEETSRFRVFRDQLGREMKLSKGFSTLAIPQSYPVKVRKDWEAIQYLYQFSEKRFEENWIKEAQTFIKEGRLVCLGIPGGFDEPRQLMGEEALCLALFDQPDLVADIISTISKTVMRILDTITRFVQLDILSIHEDMAGRAGPIVGPKMVNKFIIPYYQSVWELGKSRGVRIFEQDSDGDMRPLIPIFLDAGINCMYPIEPAAGMDIVKLRSQYGRRLAFIGGIDKFVLRRSKEEIISELEYKIPPMIHSGGCMLGLDHRIPNGTPLNNYRFYIEKVWEIFEREV